MPQSDRRVEDVTPLDAKHRTARRDGWLLGLVLASALALVALELLRFLAQPLAGWEGLSHDRNYHYMAAQRLAVDLVNLDPLAWLRDIERFRMWPPLHGLLASAPIALAGIDFRAAIAPSLLGFAATIVFGFLAARRAAPRFGSAAGLVSAVFIAASPAHQRFAADVMLESLGAGLTLACLYFFLGLLEETRAAARAAAARWLGLCLTLLLLEKYNYYLLTAASLAMTSLVVVSSETRARLVARTRALLRAEELHARLRREALHPLNWLALGFACLAVAVAVSGGGSTTLFGQRISLTRPFSAIHLAYLCVGLRVALWWRREGYRRLRRAEPPFRNLVLWHVIPMALWFALPRRLGYFLHHVSPANGPAYSDSILSSATYYARAFVADYHGPDTTGLSILLPIAVPDQALGAGLAIALALLVLIRFRSLGPRSRAAVGFATASLCLTLLHPHNLSRFLHSWLASVWVVSGIGAGVALGVLRHSLSGRMLAAAATCLVVVYASGAVSNAAGSAASYWRGPAPEPTRRSIAALMDLGLTVQPSGRAPESGIALVANTPAEPLLEWILVEQGFDRRQLSIYTPKRVVRSCERFFDWAAKSRANTMLLLEITPQSPWYESRFPSYEQLSACAREQQTFRASSTLRSPAAGAQVTRFERAVE